MPELIVIPIGILAIWYFAYGNALLSSNQAQAQSGFWSALANAALFPFVWGTKETVKLAKYVAHFMFPALKAAEGKVAAWIAGNGEVKYWETNLSHRIAHAAYNVADWADHHLRREIVEQVRKEIDGVVGKHALTKAPPLPQRRLTQHEIDVEFQRLIEGQFVHELAKHDPKFDWDKNKWLRYLGIIGLGGAKVLHPPPTTPKVAPQPAPGTGTGTVPIAPPQPTTVPHTDDQPNPYPGTQLIPSVISGKDKWARGQIVKLQKKDTSLLRHLGPLAFLTIPLAGITTLLGLLECKNFGRFGKALCSLPANIFNDFLALLTDFLILTNICTIIPWLEDAAGLVEPFIVDFTTGAAALTCAAGYDKPPALNVPTLRLPGSPVGLPALQLP